MKAISKVIVMLVLAGTVAAARTGVTVDSTNGMRRGGKPYFIKGAGGDTRLNQLAERGANSIRTWSTDGLENTLNNAAKAGLTVSAGIWLEPECSWFSYRNAEHCAKQAARVKAEVLRHRDHPALLAWGIGNEAEGDGTNTAFWQQIGRLAVLVREVDPAHPTFTALAGINAAKAGGLNREAPQLDFVGVNTYGGLFSLRKTLEEVKWTRPWVVTEWGPQGFWERPRGAGGMSLEQTSTEKAEMIQKAYAEAIAPRGACLGSYVFVWGWKYEATTTWFGLLTHSGETTASLDALQHSWNGQRPANAAPSIIPITGVPGSAVAGGTVLTANTAAQDADGDRLTWKWTVLPEAGPHNAGALPPLPTPVPDTVTESGQPQVIVKVPHQPGRYRVHVEVSDGNGHAATANAPLLVK